MQRVPLDTLILQMVSMGLPDVRKFPFVEAPPPEAIENAVLVKYQSAFIAKIYFIPNNNYISAFTVFKGAGGFGWRRKFDINRKSFV